MFESSTLTTIFSTNAQILGALVSILAAFVHFRILRLQDYLIGDGKALYISKNWKDNWDKLEKNHVINSTIKDTLYQRLEDAIARKSISEIGDVFKNLYEIAKATEQPSDRNSLLYIIEHWFNKTRERIRTIRNLTLLTVALALITIITSIFFLLSVDSIYTCNCYALTLVIISFMLTSITLILSGYIIYLGLCEDTAHERDTYNPLDISTINKKS